MFDSLIVCDTKPIFYHGLGERRGEGWGLKREGEGWEGERGIIMIGKEAGASEAGLL